MEFEFQLCHQELWSSSDKYDKGQWCARHWARCGDAADGQVCEDSCLAELILAGVGRETGRR